MSLLIQIEEPGTHRDEVPDDGLTIGLEPTARGLRVAASVGGNVELVRGADGGLEFLPAVAELSELVVETRRQLAGLARRPVSRAVAVVPTPSSAADRAALLQAIEAGGLELLRLIEAPVAIALGAGLDRRAEGVYLFVEAQPDGWSAAQLLVRGGTVRLVGLDWSLDAAGLAALVVRDGPFAGLIAPGIAEGADLARQAGLPLLDGFERAEFAVLGAALLAEALA